MTKELKSQSGAAALVSTIIVASVILSIVLSLVSISLDTLTASRSFKGSLESFYAAEAGLQEALFQLKKEHQDLTFEDIMINGLLVHRQFVAAGGGCQPNCPSNIESLASTSAATSKVQFSCDAEISGCSWAKLVP